MSSLFDLSAESSTVEAISREKWKFANTYSVRSGLGGGEVRRSSLKNIVIIQCSTPN